jgi:hypothetical protein
VLLAVLSSLLVCLLIGTAFLAALSVQHNVRTSRGA